MLVPPTNREIQWFVYYVLAPSFNIIPMGNFERNIKELRFNKLTEEQYVLMDFLEHQKTATISGSAGTGKTMLAIERAKRLSQSNDKVLFLCYNKQLKKHLEEKYPVKNVFYYTIDQFAFKYAISGLTSLGGLEKYLTRCFEGKHDFEFQHVIVDEGQDFGQVEIEQHGILEILSLIIKDIKGTFYVFYDRLQIIQGVDLPKYISESDCKITLYKNCRNTINIAQTSLKPLDLEPNVFEGNIIGNQPKLILDSEDKLIDHINDSINEYKKNGYNDIVILSTKALTKSKLYKSFPNEEYVFSNQKYLWTTVRKFKGLEADAIILVDVDETTFLDEKLLFYVGASRAKLELSIILSLTIEMAKNIVNIMSPNLNRFHPEKGLAAILGAIIK